MGSQVSLPLWVVVVMAILAVLAALDRILIPSVRWALRRRANRAIEELNTKLKLRIQPFKLTKRQVLTDRLVFDPEVLRAAEEYSTETGVPNEVAMEKVRRYAREIVPAFSAYAYFRVGTRIARAVSHMLYRVRIGVRNDEALAAVDPASSVIFVINHRSNMDYVLVTYVAATSSALISSRAIPARRSIARCFRAMFTWRRPRGSRRRFSRRADSAATVSCVRRNSGC
jgi:glycerol-3-phosphate O-acyltransferase